MYSYVLNNPLVNTDPDGLFTQVACNSSGVYPNDGSSNCDNSGNSGDSGFSLFTSFLSSAGSQAVQTAVNITNTALTTVNNFRQSSSCTGSLVAAGQTIGGASLGAFSAQAGFAGGALLGLETGPGALVTGTAGAALLGPAGTAVGIYAGGGLAGVAASILCSRNATPGGGGSNRQAASDQDARTADQIISQSKADIRKVFPGQYLNSTLSQIKEQAAEGVKEARTALKLLTNNRFNK